MKAISQKRLARAAVGLLVAKSQDRPAVIRQLAAYLVQTKQTAKAAQVAKTMAHEVHVQQGHLFAEVLHARPLTAAARTEIEQFLKRATGAKTVELHTIHKPEVLGGVVIRTANLELDASVRAQLKQIAGGLV